MNTSHTRTVPIATAPNLRDLGGLPSTAGEVRRGLVYRSAALSSLTGADQQRFVELGIHTVYDLRTAEEATASRDRLPEGVDRVSLDVLADSSTSVAASLGRLASDPHAFAASLAGGRAQQLFEETYRDFVRLPSALRAYRAFYASILDEDRHGAALFHCTTGKDRTGWAAATLLTLLGVSESDVYQDYLQTNTDLLPALEPVLRRAETQGVDRELLLPVLGVRESYLAAAFTQMRNQFGSIHGYAREGLGLSADDEQRLRELFL
ncbi:tyrosine-protein phosphatase [Microbacterium azadirachtae]|uniref:Protein-tyrosine phosphatase n=1 Tax=Microbacterium azadirachtae TaxID=582680 RepID=A0A1I6G8I1_9MICO|nr:tyrosine-protein phosphatase [Microbacterium azadirachtae]SDL37405.1 protein-tyrosine phosphatase [Microbacterium azadirachtae]SEF68280.1 protein-tyrosine phosphatase [Microbacterium azadirachtae]SEF68972.1 protein-tyrosine phosphatase [Microbacterium azadirachtae]SFR38431.1 protein-tyrosine phosphatase [Microbacterium azadirachtae]